MYNYQIEILKERLSDLNSIGQEYAMLAVNDAPTLLNVPIQVLKNKLINNFLIMILLTLPLLAASLIDFEFMFLRGFIFGATASPALIICTLNLASWASWESLKDEINGRTFNFEKLLKNACNSRKMYMIALLISATLTFILSIIIVQLNQGLTLALIFIVPYLAFCLYKGTLTKIRTTYLLHVSSDIAKFKGSVKE